MCCSLDDVEKDHRDGAEEQHRGSVLDPAHFAVFVDSADAINQAFDRAQSEIEKGFFAIENSGDKNAERFGDGENHREKKENLEPAVSSHVRNLPGAIMRPVSSRKGRW